MSTTQYHHLECEGLVTNHPGWITLHPDDVIQSTDRYAYSGPSLTYCAAYPRPLADVNSIHCATASYSEVGKPLRMALKNSASGWWAYRLIDLSRPYTLPARARGYRVAVLPLP